jgi:hypothetical protein
MHSISTIGANGAPPAPENLQVARIAARVGVSPSVASVMAGLAWGDCDGRRDDVAQLASLTATRVEAAASLAAVLQ